MEKLKVWTQLIITIVIIFTYVALVLNGKASVEGFIGLAMYIIKKFLDFIEDKPQGEVK